MNEEIKHYEQHNKFKIKIQKKVFKITKII